MDLVERLMLLNLPFLEALDIYLDTVHAHTDLYEQTDINLDTHKKHKHIHAYA